MKLSEYVSLGHPDKIADYISEYTLDRIIEQDNKARYALEVQIKDNCVSLAGEVTTKAKTNYKQWVSEAIDEIGYTRDYYAIWGDNTINPDNLTVIENISQQSDDISIGVDNIGWGDQGIFFGMAVNNQETGYMPYDHFLAKKICNKLYCLDSKHLGIDIKTQVLIVDDNVKKVIVAIPMLVDEMDLVKDVVRDTIKGNYNLIINGTGVYRKHASVGDCGTTGRKLVVDFYGGNCNVGGGSPWTKDATKADLTLNMYARELALMYVKKHGIEYVRTGLECSIGSSNVTIAVWGKKNNLLEKYSEILKPNELIKRYELDTPIYTELCRNGLFSRL